MFILYYYLKIKYILRRPEVMSGLLTFIGCIAVVVGIIDLLDTREIDINNAKLPIFKIVLGGIVAGIGQLLKYYGL